MPPLVLLLPHLPASLISLLSLRDGERERERERESRPDWREKEARTKQPTTSGPSKLKGARSLSRWKTMNPNKTAAGS